MRELENFNTFKVGCRVPYVTIATYTVKFLEKVLLFSDSAPDGGPNATDVTSPSATIHVDDLGACRRSHKRHVESSEPLSRNPFVVAVVVVVSESDLMTPGAEEL